MIAHTPGPWEARDGTYVKIDSRIGVRIVSLERFPEVTDSEIEANKQLIAAAPDLVDAAIATCAELSVLHDLGGLPEFMNPAWKQLAEAIRKAKGEAA